MVFFLNFLQVINLSLNPYYFKPGIVKKDDRIVYEIPVKYRSHLIFLKAVFSNFFSALLLNFQISDH